MTSYSKKAAMFEKKPDRDSEVRDVSPAPEPAFNTTVLNHTVPLMASKRREKKNAQLVQIQIKAITQTQTDGVGYDVYKDVRAQLKKKQPVTDRKDLILSAFVSYFRSVFIIPDQDSPAHFERSAAAAIGLSSFKYNGVFLSLIHNYITSKQRVQSTYIHLF